MADVFISYARSDQAMAARVAKGLQAAGFDVWWDAHLPAHRDYSEIIQGKLEDAKAVVVLWSKAAAGSQWVRAEADFARNAGKLVQAQLDSTLPPMPFNQIQSAALKGWRGSAGHAGWAKLQASVDALASGEDRPAREAPRTSLWDRVRAHRSPIAAALTLLVLAFAAGLFFLRPADAVKPVVAVLPFRSLDAQDASLVAGIWEDTRTSIGRNPQLVVLGPETAQHLAENGEGAARKAADYLVEASVRTAGDRVRVSANLVRTRDGEQLWSQDFDRKLDDVFALQSEIASEIEGRIRGRLAMKGGATPEHIATSGEVYALYSDARAKIRKRDYADAAIEAKAELERALKLDPNFAPAWAALSLVIQTIPASHKNWDVSDPSEAYARKAIDLAPNLAAGHGALAVALGLKGPVARAEVERAVALDPSDFEAQHWLANMRREDGDNQGAIEGWKRVIEMEPFFWPAVSNLYDALKETGDQAGIEQLLAHEKRMGADYLGTAIEVQNAQANGNLAQAVNLGLAYWRTGRPEGRPMVGGPLWVGLLQLGLFDQAAGLGPGPSFGPPMWRLDPKGLDMMEAQKIAPNAFFKLEPLTENAARLYLASGRGKSLAAMYRALKLAPPAFADLMSGEGPEHFTQSAPLIALALREDGDGQEANALLALAEAKAKDGLRSGKPADSVALARIYAVQGRKGEALSLLTAAISRGWLPQPPQLLSDLHSDPALASLRGDAEFEKGRARILGTIARERAQVNAALLRSLPPPTN